MRRKKEQGGPASTTGDGKITPAEIQAVEFRLALRGYDERDVDAFLDRITEDLSAYLEENQRLRGVGHLAPSPATPGTTDEARREAERILAEARQEAAAIIRRAEQQAAASGASGSPDARTAVTPFLNTEREFLQSLGTLVQTHAEEIKQMVLALRARQADAGSTPAAADVPAAPPSDPALAFEAASASEIGERLGVTPSEEPSGGSGHSVPSERDPLLIEAATEPAFSSEGAPAGERRERSLRELFWGEE